jgi:hypothetical protein
VTLPEKIEHYRWWLTTLGEDERAAMGFAEEFIGNLIAAYTAALTALEASDSDRQKLKADRLDLLAQLESIDQAAAKFYPGEKMLFGEATSRLVEDAGKWKAEIAKEQRDG